MSGGESPFYNISASLVLTGRLDVAALGRALFIIVRRHEALRTTFRVGPDGSPCQVIHPPFPVSPIGINSAAERAGRGSSPLGGGGLGKGGGQEGGGCNGVRNAPLLASPLIQPPPPQGGGTHRPASLPAKLAPMGP